MGKRFKLNFKQNRSDRSATNSYKNFNFGKHVKNIFNKLAFKKNK